MGEGSLTIEPIEDKKPADASLRVAPGICGFNCVVHIYRIDKRNVRVAIEGSECKQIQRLSAALGGMSLKELFMPLTRNPVYAAAEKAGCHASCVLPAAILKATEAALGMAIPRDVTFFFDPIERGDG